MATIVLQAAGAFIGSYLGATGAAIVTAAATVGGYLIDRSLAGPDRIEGARLDGARAFTAEEGAPLPRVYGAARIGGTLIWATRFEEVKQTQRQGGKGGGTRVTQYSYFGNAAFALCEGPIAGIRRVWADGKELDLTRIEMRVYCGNETQLADPLIEVKQGAANTPAYRGVAYVVFERLPLDDFGNRLPQFNFEVLRPVADVENDIRAVALIPGSTEFGLASQLVTQEIRPGQTEILNRHVLHARTDLEASLDELQMLLPNLEHVALVISWYGNDLRAGDCRIRPAVVDCGATGFSLEWSVAGISHAQAVEVSRHEGHAAYGGTPADATVLQAIAELKARGLKVTIYPFVMMDVPAGNALPDPYGASSQQAYPWRGRITAYPAAADRTVAARSQVNAFCGDAARTDFFLSGKAVTYGGDPDDWGYRRFVLHCANLVKAAGGVDAFLIGSELRELTRLRDASGAFPFVEQLCALAGDVRAVLGEATKITYGADWSEYFGYHPQDGSGDVYFNLDPLWAHPAIDAVGIDNYMPLSDWRDGDEYGGHPDGATGPYDPEALRSAIAGGEGFDWFYASSADREARHRTPITDGAHGKPWVFRYKDLVSWWSNPHRNRIGGAEVTTDTEWVPKSKPLWFTEIGCPAIDKGPNQPNVFYDPKSGESALPYFSNGGRCDFAQKQFLRTHFGCWNPESAKFESGHNPLSPVYGGRMLDHARVYVWAWDARPFPAFPLRGDVWADGGLWQLGHWMNGRAESVSIGALINAILADHGLPPADVSEVSGTANGYLIADPTTARSALESLVEVFRLDVWDTPERLVFADATAVRPAKPVKDLVLDEDAASIEVERTPDGDLPAEMVIAYRDPLLAYQSATARQRRPGASGSRQTFINYQGALDGALAATLLDTRINDLWSDRETVRFAVPASDVNVSPGAHVTIEALGGQEYVVQQIEEGLTKAVVARRARPNVPTARTHQLPSPAIPTLVGGKPLVVMLDLPMMNGTVAATDQFRVAAWQKPWTSQTVYASPESSGFELRTTLREAAKMGALVSALVPAAEGRFDMRNFIEAELFASEIASVSRLGLLNGANAVAIRAQNGLWEIAQFELAEEVAPDRWRLGNLLRGQLGTGDAAAAGAAIGARIVVLDTAVVSAGLKKIESGLLLNWRVGPVGSDLSEESMAAISTTGGLRALRPLSPVHLRCSRLNTGDLELSWVRRGRIDADDWEVAEIPLGEETETYKLEVRNSAGLKVREAEVVKPGWSYTAAQIAHDHPGASAFKVQVRQLGTGGRLGIAAEKTFQIN
ncbi:MAG: glycoside hydrolase/phage tail family protein [Rhizobiaceae bacterium]|nr:glycoside hydrolase/phage tail family protein [Rhizobiaceae bacterium]